MYRILVCYGKPDDPKEFDEYWLNVHTPLGLKIPGIVRFQAGKCESIDGAPPPYYLVATLEFANEETLRAAMVSPEMAIAKADTDKFATGGVTLIRQQLLIDTK